jgi:hypothetical protein
MTDTVDEDHAQAFLSLLAANTNLLHVYDTIVANPTPDPPYVLTYITVSWPRDGVGTSLTAQQVTVTATANVHCAGLTPAAARAVQMQVRSSLLNARPVITGRYCSPIKQDDSQVPVKDETTGRPVYDAVSVFSFSSTG